jgi:hypothetical protein
MVHIKRGRRVFMKRFFQWLMGLFKKKKPVVIPNVIPYSKSLPRRWTAKQWAKMKRKKKNAYQSRKYNSTKRRGK